MIDLYNLTNLQIFMAKRAKYPPHTNRFVRLACVCLSLLPIACQKENVGLQLVAEGFGNGRNSKVAIDGLHSNWVDGESVRINGVNKTVTVDGSQAYLPDVPNAGTYRAIYPDSLNSTATLTDDNLTVSIPHNYNYMEADGHQHLGSPMVAYGTSDRRLMFKHLTAAITVEIKNIYGFTIEIDSITVSSNLYQLSGDRNITLGESIAISALASATAADRQVKICFPTTHLRLIAGTTRQVQIPVLPVGNNNRFTITINAHKVDDADVLCQFQQTQGNAQATYSLERAQLGYAGATLGKAFSISDSKKVIISQGNLQYTPATAVWAFATHQYDICETGPIDSTTRYRADGTDPIDLFAFGTSGFNNMYPYMTSSTLTDYAAPTTSISQTDYDWGYHNAISNGGNATGQWYTLSSNQWKYLLNTRTTSTVGINSNNTTLYTLATIGGTHKGLILFPDEYTHPADITTLSEASFNAESDSTAAVSYSDWNKMEAAGAVFLPCASYRYFQNERNPVTYIGSPIQGMYWTAGGSSLTKSRYYVFNFTLVPTSREQSRYYGMSVRLVKDL